MSIKKTKILFPTIFLVLIFGLGVIVILNSVKKPAVSKPQYNILFSDFNAKMFIVKNGKLTMPSCEERFQNSFIGQENVDIPCPKTTDIIQTPNRQPSFLIYDVDTKKYNPANLEAVQNLTVDMSEISKDNYILEEKYTMIPTKIFENNFSAKNTGKVLKNLKTGEEIYISESSILSTQNQFIAWIE
jgi:hypothetical protein